ncbi:MAG: M23 family metallopeptidase [Acutalibacteraceae bacterium]
MKRKISVLLSLILVVATLFSISVSAKANLPTISSSKPIITYTYDSTGKVDAYKDASLKTKTGGYIACATDECRILEIKGDAVKVKYPVANGQYKTAWFSRNEFTRRDLANDAAQSTFTAKTSATVYKWKGNSAKLGTVAAKDFCYLLRGDEKSDWLQIIYPISGGYKMGWVKGDDYLRMIGKKTVTTSTVSSSATTLTNALYGINVSSSKITCGFDGYTTTPGRHEGIDFKNENGANVYSLTDGVVTNVVEGKTGSGGLSTIAIYYKASDKTVIYLHSNPVDSLEIGDTVKKGQKIATESWRGVSTSKSGHTHVEVRDGKKTSAAYSVKNYTLDNQNPKSFWNSLGYSVM